jgi:hypothetical protein
MVVSNPAVGTARNVHKLEDDGCWLVQVVHVAGRGTVPVSRRGVDGETDVLVFVTMSMPMEDERARSERRGCVPSAESIASPAGLADGSKNSNEVLRFISGVRLSHPFFGSRARNELSWVRSQLVARS